MIINWMKVHLNMHINISAKGIEMPLLDQAPLSPKRRFSFFGMQNYPTFLGRPFYVSL